MTDPLPAVAELVRAGQMDIALQTLVQAEVSAVGNALGLRRVGEGYTYLGAYSDALRCYEASVAILPDEPRLLYDLATALISAGQIVRAEATLDEAIALDPADAGAYYNRSTLRVQTLDHNHVRELEVALPSFARTPGETALYYALAKELEDLGDYARAFDFLERGASSRRSRLSYNVEQDVGAMRQISEVFDAAHFAALPTDSADTRPVFVLGLPRSGSTLVDRILSSHSEVHSLGEISDFALALTASLPESGKAQMIARAGEMNFAELGQAYRARTLGYGREEAYLIDKTPSNFLYIGLIALALPEARIIHVRRDPRDVCLAIYKTLFRMGYPYSYSQSDLADYYIAYHRLMEHWRAVLPGRMIEIDYEAIVSDQEGATRQLLGELGLSWDPDCLDFHANAAPTATASAAQVRQPLHNRSVGLWRKYEKQLNPLIERLAGAGIPLQKQ